MDKAAKSPRLSVSHGRLEGPGVRFVASPNRDEREGGDIDLLVVHNISLPPGQYGGPGIEQLFTNSLDPAEHPYYREIHEFRVSAHALIRRDGEIVQFVPFDQRAWHAGQSSYCGRERCNDFSIGIELEGCDDEPFEPIQYRRLAALASALFEAYPKMGPERITGHSDIAPGRKTDPGPHFEWAHFRCCLDDNHREVIA
ncbi:MAG: 1,6-anhydro-N-acetylmuramyl-L-alanine amidase AmpD [Pseudomonadota bacterium]